MATEPSASDTSQPGPDLGMWSPLGNLCVEAHPA